MRTSIKICIIFIISVYIGFFLSGVAGARYPEKMKASPHYLVILVHGIGADAKGTFIEDYGDFKGYLEKSKLEEGLNLKNYVYAYDFSWDLQSSKTSAYELGDENNDKYWIGKALDEFAQNQGYSSIDVMPEELRPQKIIIIAHSMGGLATRYYLTSDFYKNDIRKVVFLNSPHLGADGIAYWKKRFQKQAKG